ncbi:nitric oxide synthase oxygenase [Nocardiopsis ansamitocini]|uniref:nitric oxide synthase oxygenase n=1 Tax=Nocardiopsis ansamitocini TaxID=1670832 RepID=UPI002556D937|nr:nitric oxide synthase oxygenase [Nocardiopsis ansamitocini]
MSRSAVAGEPTERVRAAAPQPTGAVEPVETDPGEAEEFLRLFHTERSDAGDFRTRWSQVRVEIARTGTYTHTPEELQFGAKVAWRNSSRCIGRLYWNSLQVRDHRSQRTPAGIYQALTDHLRISTNGGAIRPVVTVLPPLKPNGEGVRVHNEQLIRYAGWSRPDGSVVGDPGQAQFTAMARRMGWTGGSGSDFDLLPLVIEAPGHQPLLGDVPEELVLEVLITHPELPWFAELGMRWHAVPVISNMLLSIGGISYPAPFNGWYMGTEIGARNFADEDRYNLIPEVAKRLGLDTSREETLWRDRVLLELNRAVLHSFGEAGVTITDHHTESRRFLLHLKKEERAGRIVPADWTWIVPPMSSGITPVYHRYYDEADLLPNYLPDPRVTARQAGCPFGHGG